MRAGIVIRATIAALAAMAVSAGSARADTGTTYAAAGQAPAREIVVARAVAIAERYWHARDVQPCPSPTIYEVPGLNGLSDPTDPADGLALERAEQPGCRVWMLSWIIHSGYETTGGARTLCQLMIHALGHTAGLGHAARGVMSPMVDLSKPVHGPSVCVRLTRGLRRDTLRAVRRPTPRKTRRPSWSHGTGAPH